MKRKFFVFLIVFLIVALICQPAMAASTTDSVYQFDQMDSDVGIEPYADFSSARFAIGSYDINSDSFKFGNYVSISQTIESWQRMVSTPWLNSFIPDKSSPYGAFAIQIDGLNVNDDSSIQVLLNHLCFLFSVDSGVAWPSLSGDVFSAFRVRTSWSWSGSGQIPVEGGSWISLKGTVIDTGSITPSNDFILPFDLGGVGGRSAVDYSLDLSFTAPENATVNDVYYEVRSATASTVTIYVAFPLNSRTLAHSSSIPDSFNLISGQVHFVYADGRPCINVVHSQGSTSGNGAFVNIQQSIGQLSQKIQQNFTKIETTIKQGATEVKNKIGEQTDEMKKGFTDIVKGITDLPGKIWEKVEEGLTKLIVPDQEKVGSKFDQVKNLAEEKLGILYQVPEMVIDMGKGVVSGVTTPKNTMTLPQFDIAVPNEGTFTVWEEYEFEIMPKELDVLKNAIKTITSLIVVIATINSIKRRYESWLNHQ